MTPSLFSHDDAIASKAQELVTMATAMESRYEQLSMLRESLKVTSTSLETYITSTAVGNYIIITSLLFPV